MTFTDDLIEELDLRSADDVSRWAQKHHLPDVVIVYRPATLGEGAAWLVHRPDTRGLEFGVASRADKAERAEHAKLYAGPRYGVTEWTWLAHRGQLAGWYPADVIERLKEEVASS